MSSLTDNTSAAMECCICFETLGKTNICTTECGHSFCLKCMLKTYQTSNACPCCRTDLVEDEDNSDDSDDSDNEGSDDEGSDYEEDLDDNEEEDEEELAKQATIENIAKQFELKGYTLIDALSLLVGRYQRVPGRNNNEYYDKLGNDFDEIIDTLDDEAENQADEREMMGQEDTRVVVA